MSRKKPIVLTILDGFGERESEHGNAIKKACTPCFDSLLKMYPHTFLDASGESVGLPSGQIGNSEVGHLNIGAGRVVYTGLSLINKDIKEKIFDSNKVLLESIQHAMKNKSKLHVMGLFSNGGVHSNLNHILRIVEVANNYGVEPVLHLFGDGRDVAPMTIKEDVKKLNDFLVKSKAKIGTIAGRFYAMDRDKRFERTEIAYKTLIGDTNNFYSNVLEYIDSQYEQEITDEFLIPATLNDKSVHIDDNDSIIFANFRPDRARQISHYFIGSSLYDSFPERKLKNIYFATMMNYEGINPNGVLYPKNIPENTLGKVLEDNGLSQLRIAETEKYAHVTFFMDGGEEVDYKNETKILIPSPKVETYDKAPAMSCVEITDKLIEVIENYDVVILNYANPDMIGHTGNYEKTIQSIEILDRELLKLYETVSKLGGVMFITADHGNAEEMIDENENIVTKHTTNKVPLLVTDNKISLLDKGNLSNIAPTILDYIDIDKPKEMTSKSLIKW